MKSVSAAALELQISRESLQHILSALSVRPEVVDGEERVEITESIRLAALFAKRSERDDQRWRLLSSSLQALDAGDAVPLRNVPEQSAGIPWIEWLTLFFTAIAAVAAVWAVYIAKTELGRAVDAFQIGNQYSFENENIAALDPFVLREEDGPIIVVDTRIGIGKKLHDRGGISDDFWKTFSHHVCSDIKQNICAEPDATAYLARIEKYENISSLCYPGVSNNTDLCSMEVMP